MYRSFVTCDDPTGVVECNAIRKSSKSAPKKMQHKTATQRSRKSSSKSLAEKDEVVCRGELQNYRSPSSFQLLEISRGAQKLNQMIDSWSNGLSYEGRSKDIAKDLFKGALDLQESLIVLGKLQEASRYATHSKKKQKEKLEKGRTDEVGRDRASSYRYGDEKHLLGLEKPWLSVDGSSRDCIEELKNAIRDGLGRHNLLQSKTTPGKAHFDGRKMESVSDMPSTSSSQSSVFQSNSSNSTDCCTLQAALERKEKRTNLIAKLMGLDDIPSKPFLQTLQKQLDSEKNLNQRRLSFDIEMPKVKKVQPAVHKEDLEEKTLKELLETMQFKGLLKSSSVKEFKSSSYRSTDTHARQRSLHDIPPIVVIKPQYVPRLEWDEPFEKRAWEERTVSTKLMQRNLIVKKRLAPNAMRMHNEEVEVAPIKTLSQVEKIKDHTERGDILEEKEVRTLDEKEAALNARKVLKKWQAEDTSKKRLWKEGEGKQHREIVAKEDVERVKTRLKSSAKMKAPSPIIQLQQKKEVNGRKVLKIDKEVITSREPAERKTVKPKNVSSLQDQDKRTTTKLSKPENGSSNKKNQRQSSTVPKAVSKLSNQSAIHSSKEGRKKGKPISEPLAAEQNTTDSGCKEDEKCIDFIDCKDTVPVMYGTTPILAETASTDEGTNAAECQFEDHCNNSRSSVCDVKMLTSEPEKCTKSSEEADDHISDIKSDGDTTSTTRSRLRAFLFGNPSFLTLVEEQFHLNNSHSNMLPTSSIDDSEVTSSKLCLDYAMELMELRSRQNKQTRHPLLPTFMASARTTFTLEELVEEVCNGVEMLRCYSELAHDALPADSLYSILERDMRCKRAISRMWDSGWEVGFSVDEAEQAVSELEKLLVSELIEEMFT